MAAQAPAVLCQLNLGYIQLRGSSVPQAGRSPRCFRGALGRRGWNTPGRRSAPQAFRNRLPGRVLYVSGYTEPEALIANSPGGAISFLQKPFSMEGLASRVREVLDRPEVLAKDA